jgi:two-component system NtrC family sensor kinase
MAEDSSASMEHQARKKEKHIYYSMFVVVMLFISLGPLFVTAGVSYVQYRNMLRAEAETYLQSNAVWQKKIVEKYVRNLQAVIHFVASEYIPEVLAEPGEAERLLSHLKDLCNCIADMGVLNSEGVQEIYAGPYKLQGKSYADTEWFARTINSDSYVSPILTGFRGIPHFIIAVTNKKKEDSDPWVFRVNVHAATLEKFIDTAHTYVFDDVFIVDDQGVLQTTSRFHGRIGDTYSFPVEPLRSGVTYADRDLTTVEVMASLEGTPWILVQVKKGFLFQKKWTVFQYQLSLILAISVLFIIGIVLKVAMVMTSRIIEANNKRDEAILLAQHSGKLASIGRLAAGVAHEINNPLAIIDQKAGLMIDVMDMSGDFAEKEKLGLQVQGIVDAAARCKTITHRLLGFARRMDVSFEQIEINKLLEDVLSFVSKEALYRNINVKKQYADNITRINSDRGQLQQIFLNIINNAIDAMGEMGTVTIETRESAKGIAVEIRDTGPGIPPHVIKHIFDPFFTTKKPGQGTGLGLSITYGLVNKLGGEITVRSEVGKGASFIVSLPLDASHEKG